MKNMKNRDTYLNKLIELKDTSLIKVITGLRRTGKSSLLKLMVMYLKKQGIKSDRIIEMNFDSKMNCDDIYEYVNKKVNNSDEKIYIFLDEIQKVQNWEEVVNAFRVNFNSDIYIASSSACKLSKEYVEIKMLPLSFKEFLYFNNNSDISKAFEEYLHFGAMPQIVKLGLEQEDIYSTVVIKDILEKEGNKVTDILLLKKIVMHLADNIGNNLSISSVAKALSSSVNTIQTYIQSLLEAYMFYEIKRFDIKGKQYLKTLGKYYIVDLGLRNYLLGFRNRDSGHIIENIVYFELLRRGYDVAIGKVGDLEIDFIATKVNSKVYVQVTESMLEESTREREIKPLKKIDDNYEKIILTLNCGLEKDYDGIKVYNLIEWLLQE
jgi:predicted ATPase (AAA+ superfamily)